MSSLESLGDNPRHDDLGSLREDRSAAAEITAHARIALEGVGSYLDGIAALPESICTPDVRYLLAKLQATAPAWATFPATTRDVALIERLEATAPAALTAALQQETLSPTAKNPGAWLSRTVPSIASEALA